MKPVILYLVQVIIASGILYAYYHFALRNKKFHQYNRFYLLLAAVVSVLVPFLNIPVYFSADGDDKTVFFSTLQGMSGQDFVVKAGAANASIDWISWIYVAYGLLILTFFMRLLFSLLKIRRMIRNNPGAGTGRNPLRDY
jgi:hypothetical protein